MDERTTQQVQNEGIDNIRQQQELMNKELDGSITPDERSLLDYLDSELRQPAEEANSLGFDASDAVEAIRRRRDRELGVSKVEKLQELDDDIAH